MESKRFCLSRLYIYIFDKQSSDTGGESEVMPNQELAEEIHKPNNQLLKIKV